jgi:hypothetical protein
MGRKTAQNCKWRFLGKSVIQRRNKPVKIKKEESPIHLASLAASSLWPGSHWPGPEPQSTCRRPGLSLRPHPPHLQLFPPPSHSVNPEGLCPLYRAHIIPLPLTLPPPCLPNFFWVLPGRGGLEGESITKSQISPASLQ